MSERNGTVGSTFEALLVKVDTLQHTPEALGFGTSDGHKPLFYSPTERKEAAHLPRRKGLCYRGPGLGGRFEACPLTAGSVALCVKGIATRVTRG